MRIIGSALVAATLFVTNAFAATDSVAPLPAPAAVQSTAGALAPGKPAGVQKAQDLTNSIWWIVGAAVIVGGVIILATENNTKNSYSPPATTLTQ
jgi:hypothetical protein